MVARILDVNKDKCVNCHKCISVCPVKYANDGSGLYVVLNNELCIGCGACIPACTHDARIIIDDFDVAIESLKGGEDVVAVVAPAVAATFPNQYLHFNGWLKYLGVDAVFDVSFGAELTVKSYLEHIEKNNPKTVIAQPCPAIVHYIQTYQPELLPYLAPKDSPMMHTIKMIKEFYPQYANHKVLIVSPCIAKKREFEEVGLGDFNVTLHSISQYIKNRGINLENYKKVDFDNPPAERGVNFSTPGGLLITALRENSGINSVTRKIEGVAVIYPYLKKLKKMIDKGMAPLLVDCLNCEAGCNAGTGTDNHGKSVDELEFYIHQRSEEMKRKYELEPMIVDFEKFHDVLNVHYKDGLYNRAYINRSDNRIKYPSQQELKVLFNSMAKYEEKDFKNCAACGYNTCEGMAIAIFNGLNKKENCHFYSFGQKTLDKTQSESQFKLGKLFEEQEKFDKAANYYENAIKIDSKNGNFYHQLGYLYKKMGKNQQALKIFDMYLKNLPETPEREEIENQIYDLERM